MRLTIFALLGYLLSTATTAKTKHIKIGNEGDYCNPYNPCKSGLICANNQCVVNGKGPLKIKPVQYEVKRECTEKRVPIYEDGTYGEPQIIVGK
jgi:hypothetical protein